MATVCGSRTVRPEHRVLVPALPTNLKEYHVADKGWVLKSGRVWRGDPGRGTAVCCEGRHPEGMGVRRSSSHEEKCLWRKPEPPESRVPLLSECPKECPYGLLYFDPLW